jgi:hypothetical protein
MKRMSDGERERLGRLVRAAWVEWAREQTNPHPSWITPWEQLSESGKEADRRVGEVVCLALLRDPTFEGGVNSIDIDHLLAEADWVRGDNQ